MVQIQLSVGFPSFMPAAATYRSVIQCEYVAKLVEHRYQVNGQAGRRHRDDCSGTQLTCLPKNEEFSLVSVARDGEFYQCRRLETNPMGLIPYIHASIKG